jgi:hypothetical protein
MIFSKLESSEYKDKYFYRTEKWDWLDREMIFVVDSKSPRMITMDYWPQRIFLEAEGKLTVSEFIYFIASKYPKTQIPKNLDSELIEELINLVKEEKIIAFSDTPVILDATILNPVTEKGAIDMAGTWKGTYTYSIPEEYKDEKMEEVEFVIKIDKVSGNRFEGTVEDNQKTGGTPGIGIIKGRFSEYEVYFEKDMPINCRIELDGTRTINEQQKHPTIIYEGEFSRSKQQISGKWRFKKKVLIWKWTIPFWVTPADGNFRMNKNIG